MQTTLAKCKFDSIDGGKRQKNLQKICITVDVNAIFGRFYVRFLPISLIKFGSNTPLPHHPKTEFFNIFIQ